MVDLSISEVFYLPYNNFNHFQAGRQSCLQLRLQKIRTLIFIPDLFHGRVNLWSSRLNYILRNIKQIFLFVLSEKHVN